MPDCNCSTCSIDKLEKEIGKCSFSSSEGSLRNHRAYKALLERVKLLQAEKNITELGFVSSKTSKKIEHLENKLIEKKASEKCQFCGNTSITTTASEQMNLAVQQYKNIADDNARLITQLQQEIVGKDELISLAAKRYFELTDLYANTVDGVKMCICGGKLELFESNFGGHEGQFTIVCKDRFNNPPPHLESNKWYKEKEELEKALERTK